MFVAVVGCSEATVQGSSCEHDRRRGSLGHAALCRYWRPDTDHSVGPQQQGRRLRPAPLQGETATPTLDLYSQCVA